MKRLLGIVILCLLLGGASGCGSGEKTIASSYDEPIPTASPTEELVYPPDVLDKINPELLAAIDWEANHPGRGYEIAPDIGLRGDGTVRCAVYFDPDKVQVVKFIEPGVFPPNDQPAIQLLLDYGGLPLFADDVDNCVIAIMPLNRIKDLSSEEVVSKVIAGKASVEESAP